LTRITLAQSEPPETSRVKIAYLVTRVDPIGGVQIHLRDLAAAARAEGHVPTVITGGGGPFLDQLKAQGIPTIVLRHLTGPIRPMSDVRAIREIRAVLRELQPDLLALHSAKAGVLGRLAGRSLGIPVVLTAHGWNFAPGFPAIPSAVYRQVERLAGPLAQRIITVSEFDRRLAHDAGVAGLDRLVTVHNGIPDLPAELRADPGRTPVRLVMVARLAAQKDHPTLLHALAGLRDHSWQLDLIGEGPRTAEMQSLASSLELGSRVRFLGQRTDVDQILANSQVSLLVTNWEGFPISILEYMRAGLPVVASSVGGIDESVFDGETGFLVPQGGVEALRDRIGRLLTDPALRVRLGAGGRLRYEQQFTLDRSVAKTLDVYRGVLGERRTEEVSSGELGERKIG
jgi:glycosyltransferase involved in cell wall biosynthesis